MLCLWETVPTVEMHSDAKAVGPEGWVEKYFQIENEGFHRTLLGMALKSSQLLRARTLSSRCRV